MVVDDDDRIRDLVKQYLEDKEFLVSTAKDAMDAKKKIEIIKIDIIILKNLFQKLFTLIVCLIKLIALVFIKS